MLPGLRQPKPAVAILVDTSGSVTAADLADAVREAAGVVRSMQGHGSDCWVVTCDAAVHDVHRVRGVGDLATIDLRGGGGTDVGVAIARAERLRPRPDVVVAITDGKTAWPDRAPAVPVVVCLLGSGGAAPPPQWATTVLVGGASTS